MTVTVNIENYLVIEACDAVTNFAGEGPAVQSGFYKENSACIGFTCRGSGDNDITITVTKDFSGASHFHMWYLSAIIAEFNYLQLGLSDGVNTGYWNAMHSNDYPGGWFNIVCDYTRSPDSGTAPVLANVNSVIIRINHTGTAKNAENTWFDHMYIGDGLIVYGDDAGGPFDLEDIYLRDSNDTTSGDGMGMMTKFGDTYFMVGNLTIGDTSSTNSCDFQAKDQILIFEERFYNVSTTQLLDAILYELKLVANATGSTQDIIFGDTAGTAGVSGCVIKAVDSNRPFKFTMTDIEIHNFGLYGSILDTHGECDFAAADSNYSVLNTTFQNGQGQVQPNTMKVANCNFISGPSAGNGTVLIESASHDVNDCTFISNPDAIENTVAATINFNGNLFINNTYDIYNNAGIAITINNNNDADASSYNPAGDAVTFIDTVTLNVHVVDTDNNDVEGVQVYVQKITPTQYTSHATNNSENDTTFEITTTFDTDTHQNGWFELYDDSTDETHTYRYASRTTTVLTLPTLSTGSQTGTDNATYLNDSGASFGGTEDVVEGDLVSNKTDGSYAQIQEVVSTTQVKTSPLVGGSDNTWQNGDNYRIHSLHTGYNSSDTFYIPLMNEETAASGIATESYNYPAAPQNVYIRVRQSSTGTRYQPFNTTAQITADGLSSTVVISEDIIIT